MAISKYNVDVLHVEIELKMTWIACIKRLKVSGMTYLLLAKDDVDVLYGVIELEMTRITCIKRFEVRYEITISGR
jgi:hypothetical protein